MNKRRGFTLIELLVVIAIIAILAAILFPVFAQAREAARKTTCLSNEKQLTLAMMMYLQDYDEKFPNWNWTFFCNGGNAGAARDSAAFWTMAIYPYVKEKAAYQCPDDPLEWNDAWSGCSDDNGTHDYFAPINPWPNGTVYQYWQGLNPNYVSYGLAENLTGGWASNKLASIKTPASWMMFADCASQLADVWVADPPDGLADDQVLPSRVVWSGQAAGCCLMWDGDQPTSWWLNQSNTGFSHSQLDGDTRHRSGENVSFVDGHAKFMQWTNSTWENLSAGGS